MLSTADLFRLIIAISSGLIGISLNSGIIVVNVLDWKKGIRLSPCDLILCMIGLTNILTQNVLYMDVLLYTLFYHLPLACHLHIICLGVLIFLISCNCWASVYLCIYYCLRIVHFTHGILYMFKMRISALIPKLMCLSAIVSLCFAVPSYWNVHLLPHQETMANATQHSITHKNVYVTLPYIVSVVMECALGFTLTFIPIALILRSLRKHTRRMKRNDFSASQLQAHFMAARTMILLVILCITFYATSVYMIITSFSVEGIASYFCCYIILYTPTMESVIVITGNSKLRTASKQVKNYIKNWWELNTKG